MKYLTEFELHELVRMKLLEMSGTQTEIAVFFGMKQSYLNRVINHNYQKDNKKRLEILRKLGIDVEIIYRVTPPPIDK